ncbi:Arc family DNA-binding protein [Mesorhizobium sp. M1060]|uniref:Arc family DNA-binding protein n=1 Tax=Mesorhizobium sp. M1060 TaxID=2957052 RepID=UPI0033364EF8
MAQQSKSRKLDQYIVRFPAGMRDHLKELAEEHNRSLNAEIIDRLEDYQKLDERLYEVTLMNRVLSDENARLLEFSKQFAEVRSRFFDADDQPKALISLPDDLLDRITQAARRSHRTVDAEVVAALEELYPPPRPSAFSDLVLHHFQWHSGVWRPIDPETWSRFRSDESVPEITDRMTEDNNYFVVAVFDESGMLLNLITHNYTYQDGKLRSPAWDLLSADETEEYHRFMTALSATEEDEARLLELRNKMEPAFVLPSNSVQALRAALVGRSPKEVVDAVLISRGILNPSAA